MNKEDQILVLLNARVVLNELKEYEARNRFPDIFSLGTAMIALERAIEILEEQS